MTNGNGFIGKQIGNYRIVAELASGSFGSVYRAHHIILTERTIAIKLLHAYLGSPKERDQFLQEAKFLEKLKHHHILPIIDVGLSDGFPYLMVEYAPNGSLRDRLKRQFPRPLSVEESLTIISQIGQALQYAHQQNIVHRDLKPENVLFNARGDALVADFGIATMLSTASIKYSATIVGTPSYMAPEQFRGTISKESDQYALGCIAYELVTGCQPFSSPDFISMGFKHLMEQPISPTRLNPQLSVLIEQAILKAMAKERTDRHIDISAFITRLCATTPSVLLKTKEHWLDEGNVCSTASGYEESLAAFEQAIRLDPNFAMAYECKGESLKCLGRYEEALAAYEQAIRLDLNFAMAYNDKGALLQSLGRYEEAHTVYAEALACCERVLQLDPNSALTYKDKGLALYGLNRDEEANAAYEQAIQLDPNFIRRYGRLISQNHYEEVLATCERAIQLDPNNAKFHSGKGFWLRELGRYEEAFIAYERATQLDPSNVDYHDLKGDVLCKLERYEEALVAYERATQLDPDNAEYHLLKGNVLCELERYEEALVAYDRSLEIDFDVSMTHGGKAIALEKLGRFGEAQSQRGVALRIEIGPLEDL